MFNKSKLAIVAAFVLGSATVALAQSSGEELQNSPYLLNPNAAIPLYSQSAPRASTLIEGRNVAVQPTWERKADQRVFDSQESFGGY